MAGLFTFQCRNCSKIHEGSPSFGYDAPFHYSSLDDDEKVRAELKSDTCVIPNRDEVGRFSESYFGWFSNRLPYYEDTLSLKSLVWPRPGGVRPSLTLERDGHLLAEHLHEGISIEEAQNIAEIAMHGR